MTKLQLIMDYPRHEVPNSRAFDGPFSAEDLRELRAEWSRGDEGRGYAYPVRDRDRVGLEKAIIAADQGSIIYIGNAGDGFFFARRQGE